MGKLSRHDLIQSSLLWRFHIIDQEQATTRWCIWMPQATSHSPPSHTELTACLLWSNNQKGREVTLDEYWVNGLSIVSGDFFKNHFNSINSSSFLSYCHRVGLNQLLKSLGRNLMLPQRRGTWLRNTRYMSRGLQFVKIADKPKCKENWGIVETNSKPGPATHPQSSNTLVNFSLYYLSPEKNCMPLS